MDAGAQRVREAELWRRLLHGTRRDRDDPSGLALPQVRQREPRQPDRRQQDELECLLGAGVVDRRRRPGRGAAAVQHEDVDAAEGLERALDEPLEVGRHRDVAADSERPDALRFALEHIAPPGEHRHVGAFGGERLRDREAHSGRGAADDRGASLQPEVHERAA